MGASLGDTFTCLRKHENAGAVHSGIGKMGMGRDLDDAVLASTNRTIAANQGLINVVALSFSCENLPNLDTFTRTDGMAVLSKKEGNMWREVGKTEIIWDNLQPAWVKNFEVNYHFEKREYYKVTVYDVDDQANINNYAGHDMVGHLEFAIHEVVTAANQCLRKDLVCDQRRPGASGQIKITADEKQGQLNNEEANFKMSGEFASQDGFNFFLIYKSMGPQNYKPIYKSEITSSIGGRFTWNMVSLLTSELANEDLEREIRFEFFKSQKSGKHINLGFFSCNIAQLKENQIQFPMTGRGRNQSARFDNLVFHKRHTFLEYIFGGCEIQLAVAVDFTLSNGDPKEKDSLHYMDMNKNEYLNAIRSVGNILQYYDSDKQIPVLGFGATVPPSTNRASHCFALNGDIFNPEVDGLEGVIAAYKNALTGVNLYGPTNFSPIIEMINDMAEAENVSQMNQKYNILLIITDGIINDMQKTIDQIVRGSSLPLSIIIVGVGSDDFESMDILDADEVPLYSQRYRKNMEADIVQFVPFRDFKNNPAELAKQTLEEVPGQLLNYFKKRNIVPLPSTEEGKRRIQQKLSQQRSLGGNQKQVDFFGKRKEHFLQQMVGMGMDLVEVQDFLDERCIHEENPELVLDHMTNPLYVNKLKNSFIPPSQMDMMGGGYNYQPDPRLSAAQNQQQMMMMQQNGNFPPVPGQRMVNPGQMAQGQLLQGAGPDDDCKVCMARKIDTVMVPCGHRCLCEQCSKVVNKQCPICQQPVQQVIKTY